MLNAPRMLPYATNLTKANSSTAQIHHTIHANADNPHCKPSNHTSMKSPQTPKRRAPPSTDSIMHNRRRTSRDTSAHPALSAPFSIPGATSAVSTSPSISLFIS
ncbi:hypothetical protein M440DRAFT_157443 [Trichoderma longibrachiatum ATCC 18648]|uniref:Uncharacterized protein n=1 Tax=Trichoderma longibrachiatum ATCC 18648 TaxID=983965 RepID=A0A2T4BT13_TRILO|nr:hypothetical protein M440DRAFT_157443 [Trichoderma longibrachiatum ATCC 18648]